jgi:hypothetical protein
MVDIEVAAVGNVDGRRLQLIDRALDHADQLAERDRIAAVLGKSGEAGCFGSEDRRGPRCGFAPLAVKAASVAAQHKNVHGIAGCRM